MKNIEDLLKKKKCVICGAEIKGYGNNPYPVADKGECCDICNRQIVIPKRLEIVRAKKDVKDDADDITPLQDVIDPLIADEYEAIDGYNAAIASLEDGDAKTLLIHIRDEEIEHVKELQNALKGIYN